MKRPWRFLLVLACTVFAGLAEAAPPRSSGRNGCAAQVSHAVDRAFNHSVDEVLRTIADRCREVPVVQRAARAAFDVRTDGPQWRDLSLQIELKSLFPACDLDEEPHFFFTLTPECRDSLHIEYLLANLKPYELIPAGSVLLMAALRKEVFKLGPDAPDSREFRRVLLSLGLSERLEMEKVLETAL